MPTILRLISLPIAGGLLFSLVSSLIALSTLISSERPWESLCFLVLVSLYGLLSLPFLLPKEVDSSLVGLSVLAIAAAVCSVELSSRIMFGSHVHPEAALPVVLWLTALLFHGELEVRLLRELLALPAAVSAVLAIFGSGVLCSTSSSTALHSSLPRIGAGLAALALLTFLWRELVSGLERPAVFSLFCGSLPFVFSLLAGHSSRQGWLTSLILLSLVLGALPVVIGFLVPARRAPLPSSQEPEEPTPTEAQNTEVLVCYTCRCGKRTYLPVSEFEPGWVDCCGGRGLELSIRRFRRQPASDSSPRP